MACCWSALVRDDGFAACDLVVLFGLLQETGLYGGSGRGFGKLPEMSGLPFVFTSPISYRQPF
jgi:hypothetical protein